MNYAESVSVGENVHAILQRFRYSTNMTNYYEYRPKEKALHALLIVPGRLCISASEKTKYQAGDKDRNRGIYKRGR